MRKVLYILGELTDSDIDWMLSRGRRARIGASETMIREGVPTESLYITLDGHFSVTAGGPDGAPRQIATVGAGEVLGEMSFVDQAPPSATVTALEPGLVLEISRDVVREKLEGDDGFAARFYRALAVFLSDRLRSTVSQVVHAPSGGDREGSAGRQVTEARRSSGLEDDELDLAVLENVSLAGARFERILRQLRGA